MRAHRSVVHLEVAGGARAIAKLELARWHGSLIIHTKVAARIRGRRVLEVRHAHRLLLLLACHGECTAAVRSIVDHEVA